MYKEASDVEKNTYLCASTLETYHCEICAFETNLKVAFQEHYLSTHQKRKFSYILKRYHCGECNFQSLTELTLVAHTCRQRPVEWFSDDLCPYETLWSPEVLTTHSSETSDQTSYTTLTKSASKLQVLPKHRKPEDGQWFECGDCEYKSRRKYDLKMHFRRIHTKSKAIVSKQFECEHCLYRTNKKISMDRHKTARHMRPEEGQWFECADCGFKSRREYHLKIHILRRHTNPKVKNICAEPQKKLEMVQRMRPKKGQCFECDDCDYKSLRRYDLKRHIVQVHTDLKTNSKRFECEHCPYVAERRSNMIRHKAARHMRPEEGQWFECTDCEYKNRRKYRLKRHILFTHTKPDSFANT